MYPSTALVDPLWSTPFPLASGWFRTRLLQLWPPYCHFRTVLMTPSPLPHSTVILTTHMMRNSQHGSPSSPIYNVDVPQYVGTCFSSNIPNVVFIERISHVQLVSAKLRSSSAKQDAMSGRSRRTIGQSECHGWCAPRPIRGGVTSSRRCVCSGGASRAPQSLP